MLSYTGQGSVASGTLTLVRVAIHSPELPWKPGEEPSVARSDSLLCNIH